MLSNVFPQLQSNFVEKLYVIIGGISRNIFQVAKKWLSRGKKREKIVNKACSCASDGLDTVDTMLKLLQYMSQK